MARIPENMLKFAVLTINGNLFDLICKSFRDDITACCCFSDDVTLARAISHEDFDAIFVDASSGIDSFRTVLAHRACYDERRAALIIVGDFTDRASIERAFNAGADDIVMAPLNPGELAARTGLALRRLRPPCTGASEACFTLGSYRLDRRTTAVQINDRVVRLTVREFAITWLLFSRAGEYVSRKQIAGAIWGSTEDIVGRTLEQHIYKLRKKLDLNGAAGVQLRTRYAHGYRIELCAEPPDQEQQATTAVPVATRRMPATRGGGETTLACVAPAFR
jgi:DNA-binding response OmpR family regulator